jgi:hypothetical protein
MVDAQEPERCGSQAITKALLIWSRMKISAAAFTSRPSP